MSDEELEAIFSQPREFSDEARAKLGELQAREIDLAVASFDCGGNFFDPPEVFFEVLAEYEEQFLEENSEQLEQFRDSSSSSS